MTPAAPGHGEPRPDFSVVVPVYNSERSLEELYRRIEATFAAMGRSFEVVFVDDGSRDGSMEVLRSLHARNPGRVRALSLYRNQGQQAALMCGFQYCAGDFVVTIDDDLQHSPEDIPALYARLQEGYDAVFGSYPRKNGFLKNIGSRTVRRLVHRIFDPPQGLEMSAFRLIRRDVVEHVKAYRTSFPYLSGMILSTTHRVANAEVHHDERRYGRSGYTLPKLIKLAFNLLVNYSALPLKAIGWLGMGVSLVAFVAGAVFIIRQMLVGRAPEGWTSLAVLVSFFSGALFAMMFVMAEYLSRLLTEVSNRPPHAVREILE
jgi:glycosyltransferase involved in cell wall biosynthesis